LTTLPFDALRIDGRRIVERHEVRYAQTLAIHRLIEERHAALASTPRTIPLLSIGAARYTSEDSTHLADAAGRGPTRGDEGGRALDARGIVWPPLPAASREIDAVAATFPRAETWKGALASERKLRERDRGGALKQYRYLHFATHGYLSPAEPLLSAIVLDQVDRDAEIDGYVTATELVGYAFASDLAVLSACDTGRGALVQGEGIIGLPFAFLIAGNADALVSLWPVYDETTARFVSRFFSRVAQGEGHGQALARVKREFAADPSTAAPVHWAGFVLYGTR
jgi:CHAT domain-containing protein